MKTSHLVDMSRREAVMNSVDCPQCGAEAGDPCTGWLNPASQALHQQRWEAAKTNQTADVPRAVTDTGARMESNPKRVSVEIHAIVVDRPGSQRTSELARKYGFQWSPGADAYVRFIVDDLPQAKRLARALANAGYGVKLHEARKHEIICWQRGWQAVDTGGKIVVRKFT